MFHYNSKISQTKSTSNESQTGPSQEGCEEVIEIGSGYGAPCDQSDYGCCPDGVTPATGPGDAGCEDDTETKQPDPPVVTSTGDSDIDIDVPGEMFELVLCIVNLYTSFY